MVKIGANMQRLRTKSQQLVKNEGQNYKVRKIRAKSQFHFKAGVRTHKKLKFSIRYDLTYVATVSITETTSNF